jgi:D-lactate dehydrogenase (cytochrome)
VSRVELLDEVMMKGINVATGRKLPEKPTLMFEFVGSGERLPSTAILSAF